MNSVLELFTKMTWQDWIAAIGFIFGIVSLIAYWEQKRANKQQETFYEFAKRHVDKDITEDDLKKLLSQKTSMESQITQQIPSLARLAVLKEQAELHANAIADHYTQWRNIADEIAAQKITSPIDPSIEAIIVDKILPQHELRRYQETIRTRVTILSISMALASSVLPFPLSELVVFLLAVPLASALLRMFSSQEDFPHCIPWIRRAMYLIYFGVILVIGGIATYIFVGLSETVGLRIIGIGAAILAVILLIVFPFVKKSIDKL